MTIEALIDSLRLRRSMVVRARCGRAELDMPLSMVQQLLEAVPEDHRADRTSHLSMSEALESGPERQLVFHYYFGLLKDLAHQSKGERRLLVVAIDDAQLADKASLEWLGYLVRRMDKFPILLVLAWYPPQTAAAADLAAEMAARSAVARLRLTPMSVAAVRNKVARTIGGAADDDFVGLCHTLTKGNRELVSELLERLVAHAVLPTAAQASAVSDVFAEVLPEVVIRRLRREPASSAEVARLIAAIGDPADPELVAELTGLPPPDLTRSITELRSLRVLDDTGKKLRFSHSAVRDAVLSMQAPRARASAHLKVARALYSRGAPYHQVALQLSQAPPVAEKWAAEILQAAALGLLAVGDRPAAAVLLRRALQEPLSPFERIEILIKLAATGSAGDGQRVQRLLDEAMRLSDSPMTRASVVSRFSYLLHSPAGDCEMAEVLQRTISELAGLPGEAERETRLGLQAQQIFHAQCCSSAVSHAARHLPQALERPAESPGEQQLAAAAVLFQSARLATSAAAASTAVGQLLTSAFRPSDSGAPYVLLSASTLTMVGDLDGASRLLRWPDLPATCIQSGFMEGILRLAEANLQRLSGHLAAATESSAHAVDLFRGSDPRDLLLCNALAHWTECLIESGRYARAEQVLREAFVQAPASWGWGMALNVRARLRLHLGDARGSLADVNECARHVASWNFDNPAMLPWRAVAAGAHQASGNHATAVALARDEVNLARRWGASHVISAALCCQGQIVGGEEGLRLLREAVWLTQDTPARLAAAHATVRLGIAERRAGASDTARSQLRAGLDLAESCQAEALADRAYAELVGSGARPRRRRLTGPAALTPTEQEVARLAVRGDSNPDIAAQLCVTRRAVEKTLTSIYRKLGIVGRLQLRARLDHEDFPAEPSRSR
jgi:DNA-binding CsgD family transcriptional regulator